MNQVISSVCELSIFYWFNKKYKIKKHENLRKIISFIIIFGGGESRRLLSCK